MVQRISIVILIFLFTFQGFHLSAQNKVLIIGIDGTRPDALLAAKTPHLDGLWKNGAYSFKAKTDPLSWSGVCWTSMLTGVWKEKHKVYSNGYENPNIEKYPHFFRLAKQQKPDLKTWSIVNWTPLHTILQAGDATVALSPKTDELVTLAAIETLDNKEVDVLFLHLDDVDHAGHGFGYAPDNKEYIQALEDTDKNVGEILKALKKRQNKNKKENWLILVSTDHGGSGNNHGEAIPEHTTIFYIASGKDVKKGEIKKQVHVTDVAVTALRHLGIQVKEGWDLDGEVSGLK